MVKFAYRLLTWEDENRPAWRERDRIRQVRAKIRELGLPTHAEGYSSGEEMEYYYPSDDEEMEKRKHLTHNFRNRKYESILYQ